jgi:hypothetical protein
MVLLTSWPCLEEFSGVIDQFNREVSFEYLQENKFRFGHGFVGIPSGLQPK